MSETKPPAAVIPIGNAKFLVDTGHARTVAYAVVDGADVWVWLDGRLHVVSDGPAAQGRRVSEDEASLMAPMPATVRAVAVVAGTRVSEGDVLVVLEAMKMELAIKAPRAGIVRAVHHRPGDLVTPDDRLVDLE